ncbi:MAG: hypothetical protein K9K82_10100 [Desulfobacteraceae bacterium]|nr:hypothetical protein [Desulfobacteraceae bacterium]
MKQTIIKSVVVVAVLLWSVQAGATNKEISQENLRSFGEAIRIQEYRCPVAALGFFKGVFPKGDRFKIFCGPNEDKVYQNLVYEVILSPDTDTVINDPENGRVYVQPWRD